MKRTIILLSAILAIASCRPYDIDEILLQREEVSLTIKGELIFSHDPVTCQLGYNADGNIFRVFDDNLGNWFILKCRTSPDTEGQTLKADLEYTAQTDTKKINGLSFTVKKTDRNGHIWLWNDERKIGAVVRRL